MMNGDVQQPVKEKPRRQEGAKSIRRTIALLRSVSRHNEKGIRLSQIARDVNLPPPTVHRILAVLLEEDFLSFDDAGKLYHLGTELYSLGAATLQFSIRDRYQTTLKRISRQIDTAVNLVIRSGYDGVCIDRTLSKSRVQVLGFDIGERRPLGIGAAGQALLSFLPGQEREDIITANASRYLKYYDVGIEDIRSWIRSTRKLKYSNSVHIVTPESIGVGVPIFDQNNRVIAAISMASITERMTAERCQDIAGIIQSEVAAVEAPPG